MDIFTEWLKNLISQSSNEGIFEATRNVVCLCQIGIYLFFSLSFFSNWLRVQVYKKTKEDAFLLFFLYFLSASIMTIFIFAGKPNNGVIILLSTLNSFCIIYSMRYFDIIDSLDWKIFTNKVWRNLSIVLCGIVAILLIIDEISNPEEVNNYLSLYPDVFLSTFIFLALSAILFFQFLGRKNLFMGVISVIVCLIIICSQYFYATELQMNSTYANRTIFNLMSLVGTSALGTILLSLAISWIYEAYLRERTDEFSIQENKITQEQSIGKISLDNESKGTLIEEGQKNDKSRKLIIGINDKDEYFFNLNLPDLGYTDLVYCNKDFTNVYKRLLSYGYAKMKEKPHILPINREYSQYNNNFIHELNRIFSIKLKRDDILNKTRDKKFELKISKENIIIKGEEKILESHELKIRLPKENQH